MIVEGVCEKNMPSGTGSVSGQSCLVGTTELSSGKEKLPKCLPSLYKQPEKQKEAPSGWGLDCKVKMAVQDHRREEQLCVLCCPWEENRDVCPNAACGTFQIGELMASFLRQAVTTAGWTSTWGSQSISRWPRALQRDQWACRWGALNSSAYHRPFQRNLSLEKKSWRELGHTL